MTLLHWFLLLLLLIAFLVIWWQRSSFAQKLEQECKTSFISLCLEKERAGHCEVELGEANERLGDFSRNYVNKTSLTEAQEHASSLEAEVSRLTGVYNLARDSHSKAMEEVESLRRTTTPLENLHTAIADRDAARQRLETLTAELQQTREAEAQVRSELQRSESQLAERTSALSTIQSALTTTEQNLNSTRATLLSKEGELADLTKEHQQVTTTLTDLQQSHQQLSSTHQSLQNEHAEHRANTVAKSEFESIREALTGLRVEHETLQSTTVPVAHFQSLQSSHAEKEQALGAKHAEHQATANELEQIKGELAAKASALDSKHWEHQNAVNELEQIRGELASKASALDSKHWEHQNAVNELEQLRGELAGKASALDSKHWEHQNAVNELIQIKGELAEKASALEAKHGEHQATASELEQIKAELADKASALEAKRGEHQATASELEQIKAELADKASALEAKRGEHQATASELEQIKAELADKASALDAKHGEHQATASELEQIRAELADKASALDAKHGEHQATASELEQIRAELADKASALEAKHGEHHATASELEHHKSSLLEKTAEIAAAAIAMSQAKEVFSSQEQALRSETEHLRHVLTDKEKAFATAQGLAAADQKRLEVEAQNARKELSGLQQKLAEKEHAFTALQESSAHLREQLESNRNNIRAELEEVKLTLAQREQALQKAEAQLAANIPALAALQKDLAAREQALAHAKSELQLQQQTIASAKAEIAEKERAINEAQAATMEITRGYESEVETAQAEAKRLRDELKTHQNAAQEAQRERVRLAADLDHHRANTVPQAEHHALRNSLAQTEQRASTLDVLAASLNAKLADLQSSHVPVAHLQAATADAETATAKRLAAEHQKEISDLHQRLDAAQAAIVSHRQTTEAEIARLRSESEQSRSALASAQSAATDATRWLLERLGVAPAGIIPSPAQQLLPTGRPLGFADAAPSVAAIPETTSLIGSPLLASEHDSELDSVLTAADRSDISEASQQLAPESHDAQRHSPEEAALKAEIAATEAIQQDRNTYHAILAEQLESTPATASSDYSPTSFLMDDEEEEDLRAEDAADGSVSNEASASTQQTKDRLAQLRDAISALAHSPVAAVTGAATLGLSAATMTSSDTEQEADESEPTSAISSLLDSPTPTLAEGPAVEAQGSNGRVRLYPISAPEDLASFEPDSLAWDGHQLLVAARCKRQTSEDQVTGVWSLSPQAHAISKEPSLALTPNNGVLAPLVVNGTGLWLGAAGEGVWHQSLDATRSLRFSEAEGLPNARPNRAAIVSSQTFFAFAGKEGSKVVTFAPGAERWTQVQPTDGHVFGSVANLLNCGEWLAIVEHAGTVGRQSVRQEFLHLHRPRTGEWLVITPALKLKPGALMGATTSSKDGSALWLQIRTPAPGWDRLGRNARPIYTSQLVKLAIEPKTGAASIAAIVPISLPDAYILLHHDGRMLWVATSKKINNPDDITLYDAEVRAFDDVSLAARGSFTLPSQAGVGALASSPDMLWMKSFTQLPGNASVPLYALHKAELKA